MWYVNILNTYNDITHISSFILTMWYVNILNTYNDITHISSFILTMWYVNTLEDTSLLSLSS